jgi:hypothetical protein
VTVARRRAGHGGNLAGMTIRTAKRQALPPSRVAYPKTSRVGGKGRNAYPLDTAKRARNALSRAAQANTAGSYRTVERKVNRLYPGIATRHHAPRRSR